MPPIDPELTQRIADVTKLGEELDRRGSMVRKLNRYYEGGSPIPQAVTDAKLTQAYRRLMPLAEAPWGALVVDSVMDRLEVSGIESGDRAANDACWGVWQDNQMDSGWKLAIREALIAGRSFALIWPEGDPQEPEISLDSAEQMVVQYRPGSHRLDKRVAALRRWVEDDDMTYATLYRPEALYKFRAAKPDDRQAATAGWARREADGEPWPLPNPFGVVPVVEIAVNRRLKAGHFGFARGEYEHCLGLIDRINLLTFLGLVVAFWMGFPLRGVLGERIIRDDDGKPLPPFDFEPGAVAQMENPDARTFEFKAAERGNLSIFDELAQLAAITKTPRHYFPLPGAMSNIAADTIRADEGGLSAKVKDHKAQLGESGEETQRVAGLMVEPAVRLPSRAAITWQDHESRSLAERADAASKLKDVLPWQAVSSMALNATHDQISQWAAMRTADGFGQMLAAAVQPTVSPGGVVLPTAA